MTVGVLGVTGYVLAAALANFVFSCRQDETPLMYVRCCVAQAAHAAHTQLTQILKQPCKMLCTE